MDFSVVMIAGDSGDGVQLSGHQLTYAHAHFGHIVQTATDFPAEIRAPAGTRHGVSGFQLCFSARPMKTVGEFIDCVIAFNPAAYAVVLPKCKPETLIIYDEDKWTEKDLLKAGYTQNPLLDDRRKQLALPLTKITIEACSELSATHTQAKKNRNMTALGLVLWLHGLPVEPAQQWLINRFSGKGKNVQAALACLQAGYNLGDTLELSLWRQTLPKATLKSGHYAQITGNQAFALGCVQAAERWQQPVYLAGYPITPASDILHYAHSWQDCHVHVVQAEDEIAAAGIALGASYAGALAVTCTSGPGFDLKSEMIGLAVMSELPLVIINVQRAGPSTGMPTKTEQTDLLTALYGRHGECPVPVLAPCSPGDCLDILTLAFRWAIQAMTPVIILSDATLAQASCQFPLDLEPIQPEVLPQPKAVQEPLMPYSRNHDGARPWIIPGTEHGAHRIGGLEKQHLTGDISYDAHNHEMMIGLRQAKIEHLSLEIPEPRPLLKKKFLLISYGCTCGPIEELLFQQNWDDVSHILLRTLYPLPKNFWIMLSQYEVVITVELAQEQLARYLRSHARHHNIVSYSQTNGYNINSHQLLTWLLALKQEHLSVS
jgi:2-oxoglutarate ferredoxin oxidoreductase subunit alpha